MATFTHFHGQRGAVSPVARRVVPPPPSPSASPPTHPSKSSHQPRPPATPSQSPSPASPPGFYIPPPPPRVECQRVIPLKVVWESRMQLLPMASPPDGLISARDAVITKTPRPGGAHHNPQRECHTRAWVLAHQWGGGVKKFSGFVGIFGFPLGGGRGAVSHRRPQAPLEPKVRRLRCDVRSAFGLCEFRPPHERRAPGGVRGWSGAGQHGTDHSKDLCQERTVHRHVCGAVSTGGRPYVLEPPQSATGM